MLILEKSLEYQYITFLTNNCNIKYYDFEVLQILPQVQIVSNLTIYGDLTNG